MTYQSPYQPPTGYSNFDYYQPDLLAPARRAGVMMFVVGGLSLLSTFCCVGASAMIPQLMQQPDFAHRMESIPGATPEMMRDACIVMGVISFVSAVALIVLAIFVRRGGKGAIVTSIVLAILAILVMSIYFIGALLQGGQEALGGICIAGVPIALLVISLVMLFGALKSSDKIAAHRYSVQYWQHAQQQAYAQQAGYGYPPPQSQQPPPPPDDPNTPPPPRS